MTGDKHRLATQAQSVSCRDSKLELSRDLPNYNMVPVVMCPVSIALLGIGAPLYTIMACRVDI